MKHPKTIPARPSLFVAVIQEQADQMSRKTQVQRRLLEMIVKNENQRNRG